ncbi:uncharacterized protein [Diadema antillarum]|uniref:uncharacterized protein n=1 Tax=Diadema antillarum TaxID=105358 RepID=UPI003A8BCFB5
MDRNKCTGGFQSIDEDLECALCSNRLLNAKFLQCLHSFCAECLERRVTVRTNIDGSCRLRTITCPLCRDETVVPDGGVNGLKPNNLANKVIQALEGNEYNSKLMDSELCCESCKTLRSRAVAYCQDCRHFICRDCVGSHSKMKQMMIAHSIKPLSDLRRGLVKTRNGYRDASYGTLCFQHNGQEKTHFCETCSMLVCPECTEDTHSDPHMCVEMHDAVTARLRSIRQLVEQGSSKQKEVADVLRSIDRQRNVARRVMHRLQYEINEAADAAVENALKSIDYQRLTLLKEKDRLEEFIMSRFDEIETARMGIGSVLSNARSFGIKLIKNPSEDVLLTYDKLNTTLHNLLEERWDEASIDSVNNIIKNVKFESHEDDQWVSVGKLVDPNQWSLSQSLHVPDGTSGEISSMSYSRDESLHLAHFKGAIDKMEEDGKFRRTLTTESDIRDMAVLSNRSIVILDGTWQIRIYDLSGNKTNVIRPQHGAGFTCLTSDGYDRIFAGEFHRDTISVFEKDGSHIESIPTTGIAPYRIVVAISGHIILSHSPASVSILTSDGDIQCTIHRKEWQYALVCCDNRGGVFILSGNRDQKKLVSVHKYTMDGHVLECVVRHLEVDVGCWHPRIACTPTGDLALVTKTKVDIYSARSILSRQQEYEED